MVRYVCWVLAFLTLFTACSPSSTVPKTDGFRCQLSVEYGGAEYGGVFERPNATSASLTLTEPAAMSGLTMSWDGSDVTVRYLGMEMTVGEETLPVSSVIRVLCETLDIGGAVASTVDTSRIEGDSPCGMFTLVVDESGYPLRLDIPAVAFSASFFDWETPENI